MFFCLSSFSLPCRFIRPRANYWRGTPSLPGALSVLLPATATAWSRNRIDGDGGQDQQCASSVTGCLLSSSGLAGFSLGAKVLRRASWPSLVLGYWKSPDKPEQLALGPPRAASVGPRRWTAGGGKFACSRGATMAEGEVIQVPFSAAVRGAAMIGLPDGSSRQGFTSHCASAWRRSTTPIVCFSIRLDSLSP